MDCLYLKTRCFNQTSTEDPGTPEHIFEWGGLGDELQIHVGGGKNGVRGGAP